MAHLIKYYKRSWVKNILNRPLVLEEPRYLGILVSRYLGVKQLSSVQKQSLEFFDNEHVNC